MVPLALLSSVLFMVGSHNFRPDCYLAAREFEGIVCFGFFLAFFWNSLDAICKVEESIKLCMEWCPWHVWQVSPWWLNRRIVVSAVAWLGVKVKECGPVVFRLFCFFLARAGVSFEGTGYCCEFLLNLFCSIAYEIRVLRVWSGVFLRCFSFVVHVLKWKVPKFT